MPNKRKYIALIVVGFLLGIIWGCLSLAQYKPMMSAVEAGNSQAAWAKAKLIRIYTIIGIIVNVIALLLMRN